MITLFHTNEICGHFELQVHIASQIIGASEGVWLTEC